MRITALFILTLLLGGCATTSSQGYGQPCAVGEGGGTQFRIIESGGIRIENLSSYSLLSDEGFECRRETGPYETHMNVRRIFSGTAPNSVWLLDEIGRQVARAQIYRSENPRYRSRSTYGNVRLTFYRDGFTYDDADGLYRLPQCRRTIYATMEDGTRQRLCAYDWLQ